MKYTKDYVNTRTLIKCKNTSEYIKLVPLLNKVLNNWQPGSFSHDQDCKNYGIDMFNDSMELFSSKQNYTIIPASEFLELSYEIY